MGACILVIEHNPTNPELMRAASALDGVPLIAVTASATVGDRDKVVASGFDRYISQPITAETFVAEVEAYLHRREGHANHPGR